MRTLLLGLMAAFLLTGCPEDNKGGDKPAAGKDAAGDTAGADKKEEKKDDKKKEEKKDEGGW